jgi:hypothetical protein
VLRQASAEDITTVSLQILAKTSISDILNQDSIPARAFVTDKNVVHFIDTYINIYIYIHIYVYTYPYSFDDNMIRLNDTTIYIAGAMSHES